ncbi:MAG: DUF4089 domain-containing protein [Oscillatoria sp. PMC 1068.18]|nr:DUF4089 domain-containing protein [Oscillatoria sp. PMC 1076.18]MEC4989434.1 DUF4089 domain-containing protein [Oscillatoria sp. PMC 1068.18]
MSLLSQRDTILLRNIFLAFTMTDQERQIAEYVDLTAYLLELPLEPEHRQGVINNLNQIAAIAKLVTEFPLSGKIEAAPEFKP